MVGRSREPGAGSREPEAGRAAAARRVLFVVRNAATLHRLLDVLPVFAGDPRITPLFTLAPGSDYDTGVLARLDREGARTVPWPPPRKSCDLAISASRNGPLHELDAPLVLLPHGAGFN
ncbi:hypothetical protein G5C51_37475, partial [Streptomyces sp. A7024]|nr:hypothetical protein [Streptomyces coryli]